MVIRRSGVRTPSSPPIIKRLAHAKCSFFAPNPTEVQRSLHDIGLLRHVQQATWSEVMRFIETERLYGQGCGGVDLTLLASTLMTPGAQIWALEKRHATLARRLGVAYPRDAH